MKQFVFLLLVASAAQAQVFECTNQKTLPGSITVEVKTRVASVRYDGVKCGMEKISYRPVSAKYEGWIRFGSKTARACKELGTLLFNAESLESVEFRWLSVSQEMQNGEDGFAQLGYQNIWDPGSGPEAKLFVRCKAK